MPKIIAYIASSIPQITIFALLIVPFQFSIIINNNKAKIISITPNHIVDSNKCSGVDVF